jgi:hypothetical protein
MQATRSTETEGDFLRTTRRYIPEERTLHNHRCDNLKPHIINCTLRRYITISKFSYTRISLFLHVDVCEMFRKFARWK